MVVCVCVCLGVFGCVRVCLCLCVCVLLSDTRQGCCRINPPEQHGHRVTAVQRHPSCTSCALISDFVPRPPQNSFYK